MRTFWGISLWFLGSPQGNWLTETQLVLIKASIQIRPLKLHGLIPAAELHQSQGAFGVLRAKATLWECFWCLLSECAPRTLDLSQMCSHMRFYTSLSKTWAKFSTLGHPAEPSICPFLHGSWNHRNGASLRTAQVSSEIPSLGDAVSVTWIFKM